MGLYGPGYRLLVVSTEELPGYRPEFDSSVTERLLEFSLGLGARQELIQYFTQAAAQQQAKVGLVVATYGNL